jgi:hypothetical protein
LFLDPIFIQIFSVKLQLRETQAQLAGFYGLLVNFLKLKLEFSCILDETSPWRDSFFTNTMLSIKQHKGIDEKEMAPKC